MKNIHTSIQKNKLLKKLDMFHNQPPFPVVTFRMQLINTNIENNADRHNISMKPMVNIIKITLNIDRLSPPFIFPIVH